MAMTENMRSADNFKKNNFAQLSKNKVNLN